MIHGRINSNLEAVAEIRLLDQQGHVQEFQCVLDTGFDGFLMLTAPDIQGLGLIPRGSRTIHLVDDIETSLPVYLGTVTWHDQQLEISILETEGQPLIGMALLENNTLTIQVWDGGEVRIEPR
jgi:predicted aspartyl protease